MLEMLENIPMQKRTINLNRTSAKFSRFLTPPSPSSAIVSNRVTNFAQTSKNILENNTSYYYDKFGINMYFLKRFDAQKYQLFEYSI